MTLDQVRTQNRFSAQSPSASSASSPAMQSLLRGAGRVCERERGEHETGRFDFRAHPGALSSSVASPRSYLAQAFTNLFCRFAFVCL
jgi:hypothetical protein